MTQDQLTALLAAARPLIAALVGIGGTFGLYATANDGAIVQTIIAVLTAAIPLAMLIWGYIAHKQTAALAPLAAQHAASIASQPDIKPMAANSNEAADIAATAVARAKAA